MENPFRKIIDVMDTRVDITKRKLLIAALFFAMPLTPSLLAACTRSQPEIQAENPYMSSQAVQLGKEIHAWRLRNGIFMSNIFPEIKQAADLLEGGVDPRKFLPSLAVPVGFISDYKNNSGSFSFTPEFDTEETRHIKAITNDGHSYNLPLIKPNSKGSLRFSQEVLNSSIRLPIAAKEASQLRDLLDYCRVYVSLLKESGSLVLENPDNVPTSEEEMLTSIAFAQSHIEQKQNGHSWFIDFVDIGSHIRVGGIAFANWYADQLNQKITPSGNDVEAGVNIAGFLQTKRLIEQKEDGGHFTWTKGRAPQIQSQEFLSLFNEYTKRN